MLSSHVHLSVIYTLIYKRMIPSKQTK